MWLQVSKNNLPPKFVAVCDRMTIGSAESNQMVLKSSGVSSLHGLIYKDVDGYTYQDLRARENISLKNDMVFDIGDVQVGVTQWSAIWNTYQNSFINSFKNYLRSDAQLSLEQALEKLTKEWFFSRELPREVKDQIGCHYGEFQMSGPIEYLLQDPDITDILVEGHDRIFVEKSGRLFLSSFRFSSQENFKVYIENLLSSLEKTVDESTPFADFVLSDGSRGHIIAPPVTDGRHYLSIRKKRKAAWTLSDLCEREMFSASSLQLIEQLVHEQKNILISGATGSGKTTFLKALLHEISAEERVLILEDTPELQISRPNTAFLNTRIDLQAQLPPVSLRDLVKQALRMRPDRIIVGEVRGEEALDLLHAMNTGHRGCLGSLHANSARDALFRLQGLIRFSNAALSEQAILDLVSRNVHAVIHCGKNKEGKRELQEISLIRGANQNQILLETIHE